MFVEDIIRFLLDNIFFLFIVIAGFLSFFRRMGASQEQSEERPQTPPLPPVTKPFLEEVYEEVKEETKVEPEWEHKIPFEEELESYELVAEVKETEVEKDLELEHLIPLELSQLPRNGDRGETNRRSSVSNKYAFQRPTLQQVTDGVVWAEILGVN